MAKTFGFIGVGHMGEAIISAYISGNKDKFYAYDSVDKRNTVEVVYSGVWAESSLDVAEKSDIVCLVVRPNDVPDVLREIAPALKEKVLVSFCAGVSADSIRTHSELPNLKVVTVMPNAPAMLGVGASAYSVDKAIDKDSLTAVVDLLNNMGLSRQIPPDKMREIVAVNGSSPAYVYYFAKAFVDYAKDNGIDEHTARDLIAQTLIGSAKMILDKQDISLSDLVTQVATKGGTTRAGLDVLEENDFTDIVKKACEACTDRAYELGGESRK
jgi:pyrroline-5-carboxylate reductase